MTEKMVQTANTVLMVRPASFRANPETMRSNHFQKPLAWPANPFESAWREFDAYAVALEKAGIDVRVYEDCPYSGTPDAIFPNNWLAMLEYGSVFTFPMEAPNRRRERRKDILSDLFQEYQVTRHIDLSLFELEQRYLEDMGSMILDHEHRVAYVCCSSRSAQAPGREFEKLSGYHIHWFSAHDRDLRPVYHTNVMMSIGKRFAIVCLESIHSFREWRLLTETLRVTGKTLRRDVHPEGIFLLQHPGATRLAWHAGLCHFEMCMACVQLRTTGSNIRLYTYHFGTHQRH